MSDLIEDVGGPRLAKVDGKEYSFAPLSIYDKADFLRDRKKARKLAKLENLKTAGVAGEQIYLELEAIDDESWGEDKWIAIANDKSGGQVEILQKSLGLTYPNEAAEVARKIRWDRTVLNDMVAHVAGLSLVSAAVATKPEDSPRPPMDRYDSQSA